MRRPLPVTIASLPELGDHRIHGQAIVPAVYLLDRMLHAAAEGGLVGEQPIALGPTTFPRFLPASEIARCTFDLGAESDGTSTRLVLVSKIALPNGMQRTREHAVVTLGDQSKPPAPPEVATDFEVSAERLYRELIPFGPRFCNVHGNLRLGPAGAQATVRSPTPVFDNPSLAGCPYLFDSAMHLACLWGQRYAGLVAYPTGFASRTISRPIAHGERRAVVVPRSRDARGLSFDLWLLDEDGRPCDVTSALSMAPLAHGSPPPDWIVHPDVARSA